MVAAIRQTVTVQTAGTVEVRSPELRAGDRAEVIVLIEGAECRPAGSPLAALDALQASLQLTATAAAEWCSEHGRNARPLGNAHDRSRYQLSRYGTGSWEAYRIVESGIGCSPARSSRSTSSCGRSSFVAL